MTRLKEVTEEVARWVFEVHLARQPGWSIAFTNPTAGPWKRVMASGAQGQAGEVHRFERDATRPDLILVSDEQRAVVIVEAKTKIEDLARDAQVKKSVAVVTAMSELLRGREANPYWGRRADYTFMCGLLWGAQRPAATTPVASLMSRHAALLPMRPWLSRSILAIECLREPDQEHVTCTGQTGPPPLAADPWSGMVLQSLNLGKINQ